MKNFTTKRRFLKSLGWSRQDRASGPNQSYELWRPPWNEIGFAPQSMSFEAAYKQALLNKKPLKVKMGVWSLKLSFKHKGKKHKIRKLDEAREFASKHGYSGIHVKPCY